MPNFLESFLNGVLQGQPRILEENKLQEEKFKDLLSYQIQAEQIKQNRAEEARRIQEQQDRENLLKYYNEPISQTLRNSYQSYLGVDPGAISRREAKEYYGDIKPQPTNSAVGQKLTQVEKNLFDPALDADRRYKIMQMNYLNPTPQGDIAILFNHIGMTLSAQKGARITNAEIDRAIKTRSLPSELLITYDRLKTGKFLTPDQRNEMVKLGLENKNLILDQARTKARYLGVTKEPDIFSENPIETINPKSSINNPRVRLPDGTERDILPNSKENFPKGTIRIR